MKILKNAFKVSILAIAFTILFVPLHASAPDEGLFTIQFTWDNGSYNAEYLVGVNYHKDKAFNKDLNAATGKNNILTVTLPAGDYRIESLEFTGGDLYAQKITLGFSREFTIEEGKVTNGGLIFIGKGEQNTRKSHQIYFLTIDNHADVSWLLQNKYTGADLPDAAPIQSAWAFSDKEVVDKVVDFYHNTMVKGEMKNPRKGLKYLYGMFGLFIKLEKDQNGAVKGSKRLNTGSYRQVQGAQFAQEKLMIDLGQGHYLYGQEGDLRPVSYPDDTGINPQFYLIGKDKFLVLDEEVNIFISSDETFNWKKQSDYVREYEWGNSPALRFGSEHIYIFTFRIKDDWSLLRAPYDDNVIFEPVTIDPEIKKITNVQETTNKLIIGPQTTSFVRKGAFIYIKNRSTQDWKMVQAPRGDCAALYVDRNNDDTFQVNCGVLKYLSKDAGQTWVSLAGEK